MSPEEADEKDTVPVGLDDELYQDYLYARKVLDEARDAFDEIDVRIKKRILDAADGCDARVMVDGQQVAKYTQVVTHRFDNSAFKRQFPDIHAQFQTKTSYWRMSWSRGDR